MLGDYDILTGGHNYVHVKRIYRGVDVELLNFAKLVNNFILRRAFNPLIDSFRGRKSTAKNLKKKIRKKEDAREILAVYYRRARSRS